MNLSAMQQQQQQQPQQQQQQQQQLEQQEHQEQLWKNSNDNVKKNNRRGAVPSPNPPSPPRNLHCISQSMHLLWNHVSKQNSWVEKENDIRAISPNSVKIIDMQGQN